MFASSFDDHSCTFWYGAYQCNKDERICCTNMTCPFLVENSTEMSDFVGRSGVTPNSYRLDYSTDYYTLSCYKEDNISSTHT